MLERKVVWVGVAVVVLFAFGFSQLYAQSGLTLEGLSNRITTLSRRISTLSNTKASNQKLIALENRVATLEARMGDTTPVATAIRMRSTLTPTPGPTATSTPAQAYITITRNMNVRRGPSTIYEVVGYATIGQEFKITGKNADGSWWRIEFKGENAWISVPYVTAVNTSNVPVVSIPVAPPTATPSPQSSPTLPLQQTVEEYAYALIIRDQKAAGNSEESWWSNSQSFRDAAMAMTSGLLANTADYCDEPIGDTALLVDEYGAHLDNVGYTARNDIRARIVLMVFMMGYAEESTPRLLPCRDILDGAVNHILAEE